MMMRNGVLFDNASMGGNLVSRSLKHSTLERMSIHSVLTGSPDGLLQVQVSNDVVENDTDVVNWIDYEGGSTQVLGVTQVMITIRDLSYRWLRLAFIRTSSTGTITSTYTTIKRNP